MSGAPVVLGPDAVTAVGGALDALTPTLARARFRVLPSGNFEFAEADPADALRALRSVVEGAVPGEVREHLGRSSGLGWNVFFAHVVGWWLPQRQQMGFLRALADRAALHGVELVPAWNRGRTVRPLRRAPAASILVWGAIVGVALAWLVSRLTSDPFPALLAFVAPIAAAHLYQRAGTRLVCGDALCRAPLPRGGRTCPGCGAGLG